MKTNELVSKANELGYIIHSIYHDAAGNLRIYIDPIEFGGFIPPLEYFTARGDEMRSWQIQTLAHGALKAEQIRELMKGFEKGIEMAGILNSLDEAELTEYPIAR